MNVIEVDVVEGWNIVDNTYNGNIWSYMANKHSENLSLYINISHNKGIVGRLVRP